jgi:hypothetical protein
MAYRVRLPTLRECLVLILLILMGSNWGTAAMAQDGKLVIFAAASLKDALDEVNAAYQRAIAATLPPWIPAFAGTTNNLLILLNSFLIRHSAPIEGS